MVACLAAAVGVRPLPSLQPTEALAAEVVAIWGAQSGVATGSGLQTFAHRDMACVLFLGAVTALAMRVARFGVLA